MRGLVSAGVTFYQITLDGDQESHDRIRVRADGGGTFSVIWQNLLALHKSSLDFSLLLRIHLRPGNFESVRSLLNRARPSLIPDSRFVIGVRPLENLGGPTGGTFEVLADADCDKQCAALREEFGDAVIAFGTGTGADEEEKVDGCGASVCYACKSNAFLIRSDGRVGKCTVALNKDYNTVGVLREDGSVSMNESRLRKWTDALYTLDKAVLACPAKRGEEYFRDELVAIGA
jgi:uncharacterized protein